MRCESWTQCHAIPVSIHAPARGAMYVSRKQDNGLGFNSRTREGCDILITALLVCTMFQFTHPRGVRSCQNHGSRKYFVSIHAPARGAIKFWRIPLQHGQFQFTHPRGVRWLDSELSISDDVSIHAPARGAILILTHFKRLSTFQFTHPRGVRYLG